MENYYKILGLSEDVDQGAIKKQFRKLSLKWHPDKCGDDSKFKKINEAYQTLGDCEKRKIYDLQRKNPFFSMGGNGPPMVNPQDIFQMFFSGLPEFGNMGAFNPMGGGVHMPGGVQMRGGVHMPGGVRIFHGGGFRKKPPPIVKTVSITFEQSFTGFNYPIEIERWIENNGTKSIETEKLYIPIPEGIDDGEMIKIEGKGNCIDGLKSPLKIFIKVSNDVNFKRHGLDLLFKKKLTLKEALLGFSFELQFLGDRVYTINNNNGKIITPGYKKIVQNLGIKRQGAIGNLIIIFDVDFPKTLSDEQQKILKQIL